MIILGIDPGTTRVGYGLIKKEGNKLIHLESGLLKIPKVSHGEKLFILEKELNNLVRRTKPERVGLENIFFTKNRKTAIQVAEARGVIINTIVKNSIPLKEVGPLEVKLAVTGDGRAPKEAVAKMVCLFLNLDKKRRVDDINDALAIAIAVSNKN